MSTLTLLTKIYDESQLKLVDKNLASLFEGLKVVVKVCGVTFSGWVQIDVSGEDETVALRYLSEKIGFCPSNMGNLSKFSTVDGRIAAMNRSKNELNVDVGIFSPHIINAVIPLQRLQAQLFDGRKSALKKIVDLYGFCENLPLNIKIVNVDKENNYIEAELSHKQQVVYDNWTKSLLDRLLVLGASFAEVKLVLEKAGFSRDVVSIEPLGMFEHAVTCKLGTDAAGLIPRIGRNLPNATLSVFNPRKISAFLED